ncbi:hypothetical protein [Kitasatospora sp. NPDC048538]|uniref:hypothetical protein n=1 Tax=unclassified Kitasatospora TaxID=2633591 RepID=UPI0033FE3DC9
MGVVVRTEDEASLRGLIERCSELKDELVAFAQSSRFDRWLTPLLLEVAGPERQLEEGDAVRITDNFILQYRLPDGVWLISGAISSYPRSSSTEIARAALQLATSQPELGFRNPQKIEQGWESMRQDRAAFIQFCASDELVLPPVEAEDRLNAYYRHRQAVAEQPLRARGSWLPSLDFPAFELPRELAGSETLGVIYDEVDGLKFYADYGTLRDRFADPALAGRRPHQDILRMYLREESIAPLPIRRLAAGYPETVDAVFRKVLRKPGFTWTEQGEELLRRYKPWYYEQEPRPAVSVIGERLNELAADTGRRKFTRARRVPRRPVHP